MGDFLSYIYTEIQGHWTEISTIHVLRWKTIKNYLYIFFCKWLTVKNRFTRIHLNCVVLKLDARNIVRYQTGNNCSFQMTFDYYVFVDISQLIVFLQCR